VSTRDAERLLRAALDRLARDQRIRLGGSRADLIVVAADDWHTEHRAHRGEHPGALASRPVMTAERHGDAELLNQAAGAGRARPPGRTRSPRLLPRARRQGRFRPPREASDRPARPPSRQPPRGRINRERVMSSCPRR